MNQYINLTLENIEKEHICCAIGDKKHQAGVTQKKEWIKNKIKDGHVFRKLDARGKVFVEYESIETAWVPISGSNYEYIYCLWVAGSAYATCLTRLRAWGLSTPTVQGLRP